MTCAEAGRLGRRNYARERAEHEQRAPAQQRALHDLLVATVPQWDRALIGWIAILGYLHDPLHLRRPNGGPISRRMVYRWRETAGFPLLRGCYHRRDRQPPLTTIYAVTAWVLSRFHLGERAGFRLVTTPLLDGIEGTRPASSKGLVGTRAA